MFMACSAGSEESVGESSQAVSRAGQSAFHSHVTRQSWHRHVGHNHGGWDDGRRCHPKALSLCPTFDSDFLGVDAGKECAHVTTDACPDRIDTWDSAMVFDFAIAITSDCRFGQWAPPLLSDDDVINYLNDLVAFTLQLSGCPAEGTDTPLTFGLIPAALQGHKFTTADLDALADAYSAAIAQALSDNGSPSLTPVQSRELDEKLHRLAHRVPNQVHSRKFTFSTCDASVAASSVSQDDDRDLDCR
jgi:hypothetical protein